MSRIFVIRSESGRVDDRVLRGRAKYGNTLRSCVDHGPSSALPALEILAPGNSAVGGVVELPVYLQDT